MAQSHGTDLEKPVLQGKKFDAEGDYARAFVPEIARLPNRYIHEPWKASQAVPDEAEVKLGDAYPVPVIDHANARERAPHAYEKVRKRK